MMLAAPELVIAERVDLFDEIEIAAELQHRMLADRVMRGEEGSEFKARHGLSLRKFIVLGLLVLKLRGGKEEGNRRNCRRCMVVPQTSLTYRHPEFSPPFSPARPKPEIIRCIGFRTGPFIMHQIVAVAVGSSRRGWRSSSPRNSCSRSMAASSMLRSRPLPSTCTRTGPAHIGAVGAVDCDQCRISVTDAPRELIPCKIPVNDSTRPFYFAVQQLSGLG